MIDANDTYWIQPGHYCVGSIEPDNLGSPIIILNSGKGSGLTLQEAKEYLERMKDAEYAASLIVLQRVSL